MSMRLRSTVHRSRFVLALPLLVVLAACGTQPIALSAQAGTTVVLAIAGEVDAGPSLGFGGDWLSAAGRGDDQRGKLVFVLVAANGAEHALHTKFVTRAWPDPASDAGLDGRIAPGPLGTAGLAQVLAIVEIPVDVPPAGYRVEIRRERQRADGTVESLPGVSYGQPLRVLPAVVDGFAGAATSPTGFAGGYAIDLLPPLAALYPHPKLVVTLDPGAAAAHLELDYPTTRLVVRGVIEEQHTGRSSIVAWRDDPATGRLSVDLVAPAADVAALALVFTLRDPGGAGRAAETDFRVAAATLYDTAGALLPGGAQVDVIR